MARGQVFCVRHGPERVVEELPSGALAPPGPGLRYGPLLPAIAVELACGCRRWAGRHLRQGWAWRLPDPAARPVFATAHPDGGVVERETA